MVGDILQPTHLIFVLVIALLVLGPKRLPEVGRSLGRGLRDFRMAMSGEELEPRQEVVTQSPTFATAPPAVPAATMAAAAPAEPVAAPVAPVAPAAPVAQAEAVAVATTDSVPAAAVASGEPTEHAG